MLDSGTRSILFAAIAAVALEGALAKEAEIRDPLAILEQNCLSCHNAHDAKGDVVFESSPIQIDDLTSILDSVSGSDPEMPKDRDPLSPGEIATLKHWVESGAKVPEGRVLRDTYVPGRDWWSLQPIQQGQVPDSTLLNDSWVKNEIDAFVLAKLKEKNLTPSPEAEPRILVRRLYYDLTGLPPQPEEITAFVADYEKDSETAWANLVDRLLDSPNYGEHWARHWLDVARYGETHGYDKDKPRPNAWPYRDYVIRSFNEDKPWSRFVREQIAGDALFPNDPEGVVALGFIAAGPWDFISHFEVGEKKLDGRIAKHMDRDDMVSATFNAFMSTTVQCAQCHHHKFDPVSMEDYYRLHAVFAAVDRAPRVYDLDPEIQRKRERLSAEIARAESAIKELDRRIENEGGPELAKLREQIAALKSEGAAEVKKSPEFGYHSQIVKSPDTEKWVQLDFEKSVSIADVELIAAHDDFAGIGAGFGFPVRYRIEAADDPAFATNRRVIADRTESDQANPGIAPVRFSELNEEARHLRFTATKLTERKNDYMLALGAFRVLDSEGNNLAADASVSALDSIEQGVRWGKKNLIDGKFAIGADPVAAQKLADTVEQERTLLDKVDTPEMRKSREMHQAKIAKLREELSSLPEGKLVYAAATNFSKFGNVIPTEGKPREIHLLHRGDLRSPGDRMNPGAPALWENVAPEFSLPLSANEGEARAALADYLADRDNPLTWRSVVNRVWLHHFGRGIVDSPNDFGRMGMAPTHPELLDFLAAKLRDDPKQSLKAIHRLMVTSATWRQSSAHDPERAAMDGNNAYYWRANRRRLSAEELRDSVLFVAGKLNHERGGPSFQDFVIEKPQHSPHYQYHLYDPDDPKTQRRSIYRMIVRSKTQPFLTTLDCADPSQTVAKRDETTTALQALALLNNPFMETMADHLARRVENTPDPVRAAFSLVTGRAPSEDERAALAPYAETHGHANACRVILNLSEFAYVD